MSKKKSIDGLLFQIKHTLQRCPVVEFKEESNELTVRYAGGGFGPPKTEDFLPNVTPGNN